MSLALGDSATEETSWVTSSPTWRRDGRVCWQLSHVAELGAETGGQAGLQAGHHQAKSTGPRPTEKSRGGCQQGCCLRRPLRPRAGGAALLPDWACWLGLLPSVAQGQVCRWPCSTGLSGRVSAKDGEGTRSAGDLDSGRTWGRSGRRAPAQRWGMLGSCPSPAATCTPGWGALPWTPTCPASVWPQATELASGWGEGIS